MAYYWQLRLQYLPPASAAALLSESRIDRLDDAWDSPLDSVLVCSKIPEVDGTASCWICWFWGIRSRRRNFGMSNGRSPTSTEVTLPEVQGSWKWLGRVSAMFGPRSSIENAPVACGPADGAALACRMEDR